MLEQRDLDILKNMMEAVVEKSENSILRQVDEKLDERLARLEQSILRQVDEKLDERLARLEQSILRQVDEKLDERLAQLEQSILRQVDEKLNERLARQENSILEQVDGKILKSESLLLDEIERTRSILEKQIGKVQQNVDELYKYYRITKLENDNMALIIEQLEDLSRRMEELERKTA